MMDKAWQAQFAPWIARVGDIGKLIARTADGIVINPIYAQSKGPRAERQTHRPWIVVQRIDHSTGIRANAQILEDLEGGADGLALAFDPYNILSALQNVMLHAVTMRLEGGDALAHAFARYVAGQPIDPSRLSVSFCVDTSECARDLARLGFQGPFMEADGRPHHLQGATEAQELGAVLHALAGALRNLEGPNAVGATLAANQDMFLTLAKFRALRIMWSRLLEASGMTFAPLRVHAETSRRMMATLDPHMNILRTTAAVFGAGLGGADSVCVLPFSASQGIPDSHARRLARNTQLILLEEANLCRVSDPASGSGYIETVTEELCERAWAVFQKIERTGRLPQYNPSNTAGLPVTGVASHRLAQEFKSATEDGA